MTCKLVYPIQQRILHRKFNNIIDLRVHFSNNNDKIKKLDDSTEVTKESLQWRTPSDARKGVWYSKLKIFASEENNTDIIRFLQTPINLRPSAIKKWYKQKQEYEERFMQQYIKERNDILGDNLAAAHFIVHRGGSVKFYNEQTWTKRDENEEYDLPSKFVPDKIVEAIDCSNMKLYYEGLANFRGLDRLEWLSFNNCTEMDDWCMDRISGMFRNNLRYLDLRNCSKVTERGIGALYRVTSLRTLLLNDCTKSKPLELTCLMLQELNPKLEIKSHE